MRQARPTSAGWREDCTFGQHRFFKRSASALFGIQNERWAAANQHSDKVQNFGTRSGNIGGRAPIRIGKRTSGPGVGEGTFSFGNSAGPIKCEPAGCEDIQTGLPGVFACAKVCSWVIDWCSKWTAYSCSKKKNLGCLLHWCCRFLSSMYRYRFPVVDCNRQGQMRRPVPMSE